MTETVLTIITRACDISHFHGIRCQEKFNKIKMLQLVKINVKQFYI